MRRRRWDSKTKTKIVLEGLSGDYSMSGLSSEDSLGYISYVLLYTGVYQYLIDLLPYVTLMGLASSEQFMCVQPASVAYLNKGF